MKKTTVLLTGFFFISSISAQKKDQWSYLSETERIVKTLASDEMAGRKVFTEGNDKAAAFIADEFKKAGLRPWDGKSFLEPFNFGQVQFVSVNAVLNGAVINEKNIFALSTSDLIKVNNQSLDFDTAFISKTDTFYIKFRRLRLAQKKNLVIFVDTIHKNAFKSRPVIQNIYPEGFLEGNSYYYSEKDAILLLTDKSPENWSIEFRQKTEIKKLQNVVGVLPGKSMQEQKIVFSAHYDHLGIRKPNNEGDSIYNGANDDASGVTAIIQLAHHFCKQKNNERSLVFSAFTFEEGGGFGGMYFTDHHDSSSIVAGFNIEMIGTEAEFGPGSAIITGYELSDFGKILQKTLENSSYKFLPDPYKEMRLFYATDNITLARKGVPAHTISTARGFKEPYWHTPDDEWDKLNYTNMNAIIKAIAASAGTMISGKDTPTRIDVKKL